VTRDAFYTQAGPAWDELSWLLGKHSLMPGELRRLGNLYRSAAADLAYARRSFPGDPIVEHLHVLVARARHRVYRRHSHRPTLRSFFARTYWRELHRRPLPLATAAVLLLVPAVLALVWARRDPGQAAALIPRSFRSVGIGPSRGGLGVSTTDQAALATTIFTNNVRVSLMAFAGGVTAGLLTALVLVSNGVLLGVIAGLATSAGHAGRLAELTAAHGFLELSCIVVTGAAGLRLGWAIVAPGTRPRGRAVIDEGRAAVLLVLGTAPWLVLAGLVEGFVTPRGIGVPGALIAGVTLSAIFWGLALWRGRPDTLRDEPASSL
jgi:uncharacterized membrane protein SpoIIM required for sporulation